MIQKQTLSASAGIIEATLREEQREIFRTAWLSHKGEWNAVKRMLSVSGMEPPVVQQVEFTYQLSEITSGNEALISTIRNTKVRSLKEFALNYDRAEFTALIKAAMLPPLPPPIATNEQPAGQKQLTDITEGERIKEYVDDIEKKTFQLASNSVILRMLKRSELPVKDAELRAGVQSFFEANPDFDIRNASVYSINQSPATTVKNKGTAKTAAAPANPVKPEVLNAVKDLQRQAVLSETPAILSKLVEANINSAHQVVQRSKECFVQMYSSVLGGEDLADRVYERASDICTRNEYTLAALRNVITDTPVAAIDGVSTPDETRALVEAAATESNVILNWEALFGNADFCECDECRSVYSPASYLVELLQFLRNNNMDPAQVKPDPKDISGTVLEKLLKRRPDLGNLQLTCENTNVVLPYIDLVNEIMESFIAQLGQYQPGGNTNIEVHNVEEETSGELLAVPQHIRYDAYKLLHTAVYPFTLPFSQPVTAIRSLLNGMDTSREEVMTCFGVPPYNAGDPVIIIDHKKEKLNRSIAAESLQLTEEEYKILTHESFTSKRHFEAITGAPMTIEAYQQKIQLKKVWECYGIIAEGPMITTLRDVKNGFLKHTGILYKDLVDLISTSYINPGFPKGKALVFLQNIPYSYAYLKTLVVANAPNPEAKFAQVIATLEAAFTNPADKAAVRPWVLAWFEKVGSTIVLQREIVTGNQPQNEPLKVADDCDISKVKLQHLDGSFISLEEYDRMQRFIRLWRKLGWKMVEVDKAITGLGMTNSSPSQITYEITPDFLDKLRYIPRLLATTGLPLIKLLAFWADIDTYGDRSLYRQLFLTHNLQAIDPIFHADDNGNYLTGEAKISEHLLVLMAALQLKETDIAAIREYTQMPDELTLSNVSILFRYGTIAKLMHRSVPDMIEDVKTWAEPFMSTSLSLFFIENYQRVKDAGFKPEELHYITRDIDTKGNTAPSPKATLALAKLLHDGLRRIDQDHASLAPEDISANLLQNKLLLLFDKEVVAGIMEFIEGSTIYTGEPAIAQLDIVIPEAFKGRLIYNKMTGVVAIKGKLSDDQLKIITQLSTNKFFKQAVLSIAPMPLQFFNDTLFGIVTDPAARQQLLAPDGTPEIAKAKLEVTYQQLMPFLRKKLTRQLILQTLSVNLKLEPAITEVLTTDILLAEDGKALINEFEKVKEQQSGNTNTWNGYLSPSSDDQYTFVIRSAKQLQLVLDNTIIPLTASPNDDHLFESKPLRLQGTQLYSLQITGLGTDLSSLTWKTPTVPRMQVPDSLLFPALANENFGKAYRRLHKASLLVNKFRLTIEELEHLQAFSADFDNINFNVITWWDWLRLFNYTELRDSLAPSGMSLPAFFTWAHQPDAASLPDKIAALTGWPSGEITVLIKPEHFNLTTKDFLNERALIKLQAAIQFAERVDANCQLLFQWANTEGNFELMIKLADDIRHFMRSRYTQEDWEHVIKPINDQLRTHQRNALIAYLLVQPKLQQWATEHNVVLDADTLFEFFLIDVQMESVMETSRIKQAISSVQTYIQRCFLGLENDVAVDALDRGRWDWMQRYRVWEANRKVFLYPENWVQPELRDNKSPFFRELESELLQKDITPESLQGAILNYLQKLDAVSRLDIVAMYQGAANYNTLTRLYIFGRTQAAPFLFYYRYFENATGIWSPWERIDTDIQIYDDEVNSGNAPFLSASSSYLIPAVWNSRLLLFWPVITKKQRMPQNSNTSFQDFSNNNISASKAVESWEIKMAWSEYKNGKWTPKQVSPCGLSIEDLVYLPRFRFVQRVSENFIKISVCRVDTDPVNNSYPGLGAFFFRNGNLVQSSPDFDTELSSRHDPVISNPQSFPHIMNNKFHVYHSGPTPYIFDLYNDNTDKGRIFKAPQTFFTITRSLQINSIFTDPLPEFVYQEHGSPMFLDNSLIGVKSDPNIAYLNAFDFNHPYVNTFIRTLNSQGLPGLLSYLTQSNKLFEYDFFTRYQPVNVNFPRISPGSIDFGMDSFHEEKTPYAIYNWELFFHIPLLIADRLSKSQRFEEARQWFHYIFNPLSKEPDNTIKRYWQFLPFKTTKKQTLLTIFNSLAPNKSYEEITSWRDHPFNPHLVARSRPTAYRKSVVMKYLDNLIAWGDQLFRQNTLETINEAAMLYVIAAHLLGPRPQMIPKRGKIASQTYTGLVDKWDAFGNAMVEMELLFPYNNDVVIPGQKPYPYGNIFGFGTSLYFGIPNNPTLLAYWDKVADRLFKIRNSMNIDGVVQKLPLFEAPIDPALLVQATAMGISLGSVVNDLNAALPCYRFQYLVQKALELCQVVKDMGNLLLNVLEKKDGEALSRMRATHETQLLQMITAIKEQQIEEASALLEPLQKKRENAAQKLTHYGSMLGEEVEVPGFDQHFKAIAEKSRALKQESDMRLLDLEKEELDKAGTATDFQTAASINEILAGLLHYFPTVETNIKPFGVGMTVKWGGEFLGPAASAVTNTLKLYAAIKANESSNAAKKGQFFRARQEWLLAANVAGKEIEEIDKEVLSQKIRINIASKELDNHRAQITRSAEIEDFLRNKYSSQELYLWMEGQVRSVYYQAYQLAYDMAKKAEKAYRFERGETVTSFIQFGYWNSGHDGLMAGEHLDLAIRQMERAYVDNNKRDYEITKHISLAQLDPKALIELKEKGSCELQLPEELFDMDFPGHYMRRIKSMAVSIPCVAGPYTSISATLTLLQDKTRINAIAGTQYKENADAGDDRFVSNFVPLQSIATSHAQNDAGLFELNFRDDRYLPFEGAGAASSWRLELPAAFRQFDYDTISEVVLTMRYTARDGGTLLKNAALQNLNNYVKEAAAISEEGGLFRLFSLRHEFSNEWYRFLHPVQGQAQLLELKGLEERLPFFTRSKQVKGKAVSGIDLLLRGKTISLQLNNKAMQQAAAIGELQHLKVSDDFPALNTSWLLTPGNNTVISEADLQDAWLIVRYTLQL